MTGFRGDIELSVGLGWKPNPTPGSLHETCNSLHPGMVATKLFQKFPKILVDIASLFMISPEKGAQTTMYLATSSEVEKISGKYFIKKRIKKPASKANNSQTAEKLWKISLEMTDLDKKESEKQIA